MPNVTLDINNRAYYYLQFISDRTGIDAREIILSKLHSHIEKQVRDFLISEIDKMTIPELIDKMGVIT